MLLVEHVQQLDLAVNRELNGGLLFLNEIVNRFRPIGSAVVSCRESAGSSLAALLVAHARTVISIAEGETPRAAASCSFASAIVRGTRRPVTVSSPFRSAVSRP